MKCDLCKYCGAALYAALALMAASCSMSDDISADCGRTDDAKQVYVKLRVSVPSQAPVSRAGDPTGGESGDDEEPGQTYENSINSVLVFFYRADGNNNINAEASTQIDEYAHLTTVTEEKENGSWVTNPVQVSLDLNTPYNVIVVANPGDISWAGTEGQTLGGVRDHIYKQAWMGDDTNGYTNFVMSSEDGTETIIVKDENTSENNPATTNVAVERLAARVDYQETGTYKCEDNIGSVEITGAAIINQFTAGTYLIKRVTQDGSVTDNVTYLGDEEPAGAGGGVATNYVIDPWMAVKTAANAMLSDGNTPFEVNGTKVNAAGLYEQETYYPTIPDGANPEAWADYCKKGTPMEDAGAGWTRVGYTLENTTLAENTSTAYNTGIVFKAQFTPAGVADYTPGNTFFRYDNTIYTTLTGMMASLNGQQNFAQYVSNAIRGFKSWSDVTEFADGLTDPTGYADYLKGLAGAGADTGFSIDGIYDWNVYMLNVLGVDNSEKGPQINHQDGINTRDVLFTNSKGRLRTYYNGQCYYIWWLRHSNNGDDTTNGIMEYAVVRNNIYKVTVSSVSSIGGDIPGAEELRAHVYVNDWVSLEEETLPM